MLTTSSSHKGRSSTLFAFTPRQVLLSKNNYTMVLSADNGTLTLKRQQKLLLHQSIALYLHRCGFSKTLKKFRSEAQIEKDDLEGSAFDLEEMCLKYLEVSGKNAKSSIKYQKEEDVHSKNKEEGKSKEKKKKKSKSVSESDNVEDNQLESSTLVTENKVKHDVCTDAKVNCAEAEKRSKDKVKKKDKPSSNGDAKEQTGDPNETASEKGNLKDSNNEVIQEKKKDSKKRKISEENGQQTSDMKADGGTKRRKLEESKGGEQSAKTNGDISSDLNSNGKTNGNLENSEDKSSVQRSQKKQEKGSVEPKSAKTAFQRVQADKVEFANERLQDNSYWAKDGADSGYGAKAQEILGQVRGRDFRHEKTKKKRGTYRGGQIDLQSHSVKFNYSDED